MPKLYELVEFLDSYLNIHDDYGDVVLNGLVLDACEAEDEVKTVCLACDVNRKVVESAAERKASLLITHHGIFTRHDEARLVGIKGKLVRMLMENHISLYVAHLPLDFHREVGNHVALAKTLGFENFELVELKRHSRLYGNVVIAELKSEMDAEEFAGFLAERIKVSVEFQQADRNVKRLAIITGSSMSMLEDVIKAADIDSFLCGEFKHGYAFHHEELGVNVFYATHYKTEIYGLQFLGEKLKNTFKGLESVFIDVPPLIKRVGNGW